MGFVAFLWVFAGCDLPRPSLTTASSTKPDPVRLKGLTLDRFQADRLTSRTRIGRATLDRSTRRLEGADARWDLFEGGGPLVAAGSVHAPRLEANLKTRALRLSGGVEWRDPSGRTVRAQTLTYRSASDWLETSAPIVLEGVNYRARGGALTGHPRGGDLSVAGPVRAVVQEVKR